MTISKTIGLGLVLAALCGCGSTPVAPTATAVIQLSANPSRISPVPCPVAHCGTLVGEQEVTSTVTLRESAGVSGVINRVTMNLRRQSDNASIATGEVVSVAGARFAAAGSVTVPIAMHYAGAVGERNMKIVVTVEATDDNGHQISIVTEIEIVGV